MSDLVTTTICPAGNWSGASDTCTLTYEDRFVRRKVLRTAAGTRFLVDLPRATSLNQGDGFELTDGRFIRVVAAEEDVLRISGAQMTRYAWHIGNRHAPCEVQADCLLIKPDPVLRDMLLHLGAQVEAVTLPFTPEGGAYGHGRTMGHSHDDPLGHGHDHAHSHVHD